MIKVEPKNSETGDEGTKPQISEFTKEPRLFCVFLWPLESCVCCVKEDKGKDDIQSVSWCVLKRNITTATVKA